MVKRVKLLSKQARADRQPPHTEREAAENHPESSDGQERYEVGYGKPPKNRQFKKGQSGNPKGRPPGTKNFKTDLREELYEKVQISEGGKMRLISKQRALVKRTFQKALRGDLKASETIVKWMAQFLGMDETSTDTKRFSPEDQAILERFLSEQMRTDKSEDKS